MRDRILKKLKSDVATEQERSKEMNFVPERNEYTPQSKKITALANESQKCNQSIYDRNSKIEQLNEEKENLQNELDALTDKLINEEIDNNKFDSEVADLNSKLRDKDNEIAVEKKIISKYDSKLTELENELDTEKRNDTNRAYDKKFQEFKEKSKEYFKEVETFEKKTHELLQYLYDLNRLKAPDRRRIDMIFLKRDLEVSTEALNDFLLKIDKQTNK